MSIHRYTDEQRLEYYRTLVTTFTTLRQRFGDSGYVLIMLAIHIGRIEQRPMDASVICTFLGLPRSTVVRRLGSMLATGLIEPHREGGRVVFYPTETALEDGFPLIDNLIDLSVRSCERMTAL